MKLLVVVLGITCMSALCITPANAQDIGSLVGALDKMSTDDKILFAIGIIVKQPLYDELEEIFFAGYPLFHEEPKFKPVVLHNMVQWALGEMPFLLQNQTFKDSVHIFVREINKVNTSIANRTNVFTYMHDIFSQMDWFDIIQQIGSKVLESWFIKHGVDHNATMIIIPSMLTKVETLAKSYILPLLPVLVAELNKMKYPMPPRLSTTPGVTTSGQQVHTTHAMTSQQPPSIITILKNSNNYTMKAMLIYNFLKTNPIIFGKLEHIVVSGIPLITEPPTLRPDILPALIPWALQSFPPLLRSTVFKDSFHLFVNTINAADIRGLNTTDEYEFMDGVFKQIDWIGLATKISTKVAVPLSVSMGVNPVVSAAMIPQLFDELSDLVKQNGKDIIAKIIIGMNKIETNKLQDLNYTNDFISNLFQNILIQNILPDVLSKPTWKKVISSALHVFPLQQKISLFVKVLTDNPVMFEKLQGILLSAIPLLKEFSKLRPEISQHLISWTLDNLPNLLENPLFKNSIRIIISEINKVNTTGLNVTNNDTFVNKMISQLDLIHIIRRIATPIVTSLSLSSGLKPELAATVIPFILQQVEQLTKTDLADVLKLLVTEMNSVNITDLNSHDPQTFIKGFFERLSIRKLVTGLVAQPTIKGFLTSTLMKSPQIVLDLGKILLSSFDLKHLLPLPSNALQSTAECYKDIMGFITELIAGSNWAKRMFDAYGKPPTGTLTGNLHFIGSYDECMALNDVEYDRYTPDGTGAALPRMTPSPKARYCRATFRLSEDIINKTVGQVNTFGVPVSMTWGMCVFASCHPESIPTFFKLGLLEQFDLKPNSVVCSGESKEFSKDQPAVAITVIMAVMFGIVILATIFHGITRSMTSHNSPLSYGEDTTYDNKAYDSNPVDNGVTNVVYFNQNNGSIKRKVDEPPEETENDHIIDDTDEEESLGRRIVGSFSLFTNLKTTLSFDRNPDDISCLHGLRFVSILLITVGNAFLYNATWPAISDSSVIANQLAGLDIIKRFSFQLVISSTLGTDSFLMISGFIMTYKLLTSMAGEERLRITALLLYLLRRFIRLTPIYMVVMMSYAFMYRYLGDGPTWPNHIELAETCRERWWYHILYVNNLVGTDGHTPFQQCMPWSWFNAVIMQLNVITPIFIVLFLISHRIGFTIVALLMVGGITATGIKEQQYGGDILSSLMDNGNYWNHIFTAPWCRVSSYCVGILLAFTMFIRIRLKLDRLVAVVGWIISILLSVFLLYVSYFKYMENATVWTLPQQAAYESLSRPAWSACTAWIIFSCHNYSGGIFNTILSWRGFLPLSRLTYAIYLLNPVVIAVYVMSRRTLMYVADVDMIFLIIGYLGVTTTGALLLSVVFERPFMSLEKALKKKSEVKRFLGKDV